MAQAVNSMGLFKEVEIVKTSKEDVRSSSFHPIDPVIACGLFSGVVVILKGPNLSAPFSTWKIEREFRCGSTALSLEWNVDGTKLAAGSDDGTVIVWSYPWNDKKVFKRQGRSNFPLIVWNRFNRDVLASYNKAVDTKQVLICNSATEKSLSTAIQSHLNCNVASWISHNRLACGYNDGTVEIHEIESLSKQLKSRMAQKIRHDLGDGPTHLIFSQFEFGKARSDVTSIAWNEELNLLATGGSDERVKISSLGNNKLIKVLQLESICNCLVWNSRGNENDAKEEVSIACGIHSGSIVIWYPFKHENQKRNLGGHLSQIHQLLFSPDGRYLTSTDFLKKLIIWSTKSWNSVYILPISDFMFPYMMTWDAASCKLGISERTGQKQFKMIEYVVIEKCCSGCKKTSQNLKLCARCHSIYYCSKECQRSHWPQHKFDCHN